MIALAPRRPLRSRWPMMIFALIGLNMSIVAITIYAATSDPSVASEPDYYAKAVDFNQTIRQRETNARLGWSARPSIHVDNQRSLLSVTAADADGLPIANAAVSVVCFPTLRSKDRQVLALTPIADNTGVYSAPFRLDRPGLWNFRISVTREGSIFTYDTDLLIPGAAR